MTAFTGEIHPAADVWPMMSEEELRDLADDIRENEQKFPIFLDAEGRLLDGRNRLAACRIAGVEPMFQVYEGDPVALVLSAEKRRHQTTGQHAMGTAIILKDAGQRRNGRWARGSVPAGTRDSTSTAWADSIAKAGVVIDHASELAPQVVSGQVALDAAYRTADEVRKQAERIAELPDDLAALVQADTITINEAFDRVRSAKRLTALDEDLAERVDNGGIDLDEAETIQTERKVRIAQSAERVKDAIQTFVRMAGHPVSDDLAEHLTDAERTILEAITTAIGRNQDVELPA